MLIKSNDETIPWWNLPPRQNPHPGELTQERTTPTIDIDVSPVKHGDVPAFHVSFFSGR